MIIYLQDNEAGAISDRPEYIADVYYFEIAALSLMKEEGIEEVNPCYCITDYVIEEMFNH